MHDVSILLQSNGLKPRVPQDSPYKATVKDELMRTKGDVTAVKSLYEAWLYSILKTGLACFKSGQVVMKRTFT